MSHRRSVLLVDDDEDSRIIFPYALRHAGFEVTVAASVDEGLAHVRQHRPDVVLLDRIMPIRGGDEMLAVLKSLPSTRDIPVIAVTAVTSRHEVDGLKVQGYADVVLKPVDPMLVVALVNRMLTPVAERETRPE